LLPQRLWDHIAQEEITKKRLDSLINYNYNGISPQLIIKNKITYTGCFLKCVFRNRPFLKYFRLLAEKRKSGLIMHRRPKLSQCLMSQSIDTELVEKLGGIELDFKNLFRFESQNHDHLDSFLISARDKLYNSMKKSITPHLTNIKLLKFESRNRIVQVRSFPFDVAITIDNRCNALCTFCNYPNINTDHFSISVEDFKKMTWLKYLSKIGLGGSIGEPLLNKDFLQIFEYLTKTFPHLAVRTITNGVKLNREISKAFVGKLAKIKISLNAATTVTWEKIMGRKGFEQVCQSICDLSEEKIKSGQPKPEIILTMVISNVNVHEAVRFVELSKILGAQSVQFNHFSKNIMKRCDMSSDESLYHDQKTFDSWMDKAQERADDLGVVISRKPVPFSHSPWYCYMGERSDKSLDKCYLPWKTCYLQKYGGRSTGFYIKSCCMENENKIECNLFDLTEDNFIQYWNHPVLKNIRKTINTDSENPACRHCRSMDLNNPSTILETVDK